MNSTGHKFELQEFWKTFKDFGVVQGNHMVYWNETFATEDKARFMRVVENVVRFALREGVEMPFDRFSLFTHKGDFDLYFRTAKAYNVWFYETLCGYLANQADPTQSLNA
ncbi:hypothetical protein [Larkinella sp. VNQ87]|uniref:hypothetical protein n=1 Tax=Larkinella sp. VNQ87 TaxID=3400921 RepID=UPI003C2C3BD1